MVGMCLWETQWRFLSVTRTGRKTLLRNLEDQKSCEYSHVSISPSALVGRREKYGRMLVQFHAKSACGTLCSLPHPQTPFEDKFSLGALPNGKGRREGATEGKKEGEKPGRKRPISPKVQIIHGVLE